MDIVFNCARCGQHLFVEERGAGMRVNCPSCQEQIEIPRSTDSQPPKVSVSATVPIPPPIPPSLTPIPREEPEAGGFWAPFAKWCQTPYSRYDRTDPRIMLLVALVAVAFMIFGGIAGLGAGLLILWFLFTILVPVVWGDSLSRRFGDPWGLILAVAPLWLPIVLGLTLLLLPLFRVR